LNALVDVNTAFDRIAKIQGAPFIVVTIGGRVGACAAGANFVFRAGIVIRTGQGIGREFAANQRIAEVVRTLVLVATGQERALALAVFAEVVDGALIKVGAETRNRRINAFTQLTRILGTEVFVITT
jgi:hypothetical protein